MAFLANYGPRNSHILVIYGPLNSHILAIFGPRNCHYDISFDMIDNPDIQISDEMMETDEIARALIVMMADEEQLDVLAGKGSN